MLTVIFFVASPFCKRDYIRYGMDIFIDNKFNVWVWDLTYALRPHLRETLVSSDSIEWERHLVFDTKKSVILALRNCAEQTIVINPVGFSWSTFGIYRALSKKNIPYISTPVSGIPTVRPTQSIERKVRRLAKILNPKKLANYIIQRLPISVLGASPATYVIAEGFKCNTVQPGVTEKTKLIRSHALDYDIYLGMKSECETDGKEQLSIKTAVFIDNYMPFHPDLLFSGDKPLVTPQVYYPELRRFFDFCEKKYNVKVVIAAHPRSNYDKHTDDHFAGRSIYKGKTAELVKNAHFVIVNHSTSISFCVLYKKPILFYTTDEMNNYQLYDYKTYVSSLAASLGSSLINISGDYNDEDTFKCEVNHQAYKEYQNNYIKVDGSEQLTHPQILCNAIKKHWAEI